MVSIQSDNLPPGYGHALRQTGTFLTGHEQFVPGGENDPLLGKIFADVPNLQDTTLYLINERNGAFQVTPLHNGLSDPVQSKQEAEFLGQIVGRTQRMLHAVREDDTLLRWHGSRVPNLVAVGELDDRSLGLYYYKPNVSALARQHIHDVDFSAASLQHETGHALYENGQGLFNRRSRTSFHRSMVGMIIVEAHAFTVQYGGAYAASRQGANRVWGHPSEETSFDNISYKKIVLDIAKKMPRADAAIAARRPPVEFMEAIFRAYLEHPTERHLVKYSQCWKEDEQRQGRSGLNDNLPVENITGLLPYDSGVSVIGLRQFSWTRALDQCRDPEQFLQAVTQESLKPRQEAPEPLPPSRALLRRFWPARSPRR